MRRASNCRRRSRRKLPALLEDTAIVLADFDLPDGDVPLVVEGAGGVLAPLGGGAFMVDLMVRLGLPVLLVARTTLGTINHTLLSLEALRARGLAIYGVLLVGDENAGNAEAIGRLGRVEVVGRLAMLPALSASSVAEAAEALPAWNPRAPAHADGPRA